MKYDPEGAVRSFLRFVIGERDLTREGIEDTPSRVVRAWREAWGSGYESDPKKLFTTFKDGAEGCGNEIILVSNIPVWSTCEHHLAMFWGLAHVGYLPREKIVGLSKFVRLVDLFARRLQVQERLTNQIASAIALHLEPYAVGVILECRHSCMESRGVRARGTITTTSALRGSMKESPALRAEFLTLVCNASSTKNGI